MPKLLFKHGALGALLLALGSTAQASEALFQEHCSSCHGTQAEGIPGLAPALVNHDLWHSLAEQAPRYITGVMASGLSGKLSSNGQLYIGLVMPPQSHLPSAELASVASYVLSLNGLQTAVSSESVEQARKDALSHAQLRALRPQHL